MLIMLLPRIFPLKIGGCISIEEGKQIETKSTFLSSFSAIEPWCDYFMQLHCSKAKVQPRQSQHKDVFLSKSKTQSAVSQL